MNPNNVPNAISHSLNQTMRNQMELYGNNKEAMQVAIAWSNVRPLTVNDSDDDVVVVDRENGGGKRRAIRTTKHHGGG